MAIVLLIVLGVAVLVILAFFAVNRWSSGGRDREKNADLRTSRQMTEPNTESRGPGIN